MKVGETKTLKLKGCKHSVKWSSDDSYIVKVSKGTLKAKDIGTTKIRAIVHGKKFTCKVTVTKPDVVSVSLSDSNLNLSQYDGYTIYYTSNPLSTPDYYDAVWKSQDESIVKIQESYCNFAEIYAVGIGETDIIMSVGGKTVKCHIVVQ